MISTFAWRNIWRNKLRSCVIITAITLGVFAAIFIIAFMNGMVDGRVKSIIDTEMSHIQIHQSGFLDNNQFTLLLSNADSLVEIVRNTPHVMAISKRIVINSMIASAENVTGVRIIGVDPDNEKKVTSIFKSITEGKYLDETGKNPVLLGERLAKKLNVRLHNKVIITVQDVNKNIASGAFRISGIYRSENAMYDESHLFVRNNDIGRLTGLNSCEAQEIAILLDKDENTEKTSKTISGYFPDLDVKYWQELSPEAGILVSSMNLKMYIILTIILLALSFGIVNTMLMVVLERVHELGMLMSIGMNRLRVFMMIMLETIYLSLTGGVLGILIGYFEIKYLSRSGVDLYAWKEAIAEIGFSSLIYPVIHGRVIVITTVMVVLAGIFSALYPAYKALKLNPSESIRTE
jgi:putative ABC transport system permease protein